ncbi:MAG TPA: metallophosphoesterase [Caulobacteraceae bacterium]|jgi:3',5'-cyclic AMP phosphodiesterase CpdA|nr:metallophosphoesterase [Caulobacteraceae bacterium]
MLRIAHLSDIHFGGELKDAVEAAVTAVAGLTPTVTVVTGDLTLNGLPREFRAAQRWLARLPQPRVVTPGNHDTPYWNLLLRALTPFERYRRYIGAAGGAAFDAPGLSLRAVNSARGAQPRPNWSKGAISLAAVERLDWKEDVRVFACHHPLVDIEGAPVTGGVHRGEKAAALLSRQNVDLLLSGHVHVPFALPVGDSDKVCFVIGAGTLSLRTRGTPPSFSTIDVAPAAFEVTVHAWEAGRFTPLEPVRLPRALTAAAATVPPQGVTLDGPPATTG